MHSHFKEVYLYIPSVLIVIPLTVTVSALDVLHMQLLVMEFRFTFHIKLEL